MVYPVWLGLQYDDLFYWAPAEGNTEVDFLIQRGKEFTAIEVKAKESLSSHDFKGLKAIAELKGIRRRLVVFLGDRPFRTEDGIEALPIRSFCRRVGEEEPFERAGVGGRTDGRASPHDELRLKKVL